MRITIAVPSLGAGGAERAVQRLASGFLANGHYVTVITTNPSPDFYSLPQGTKRVRMSLTGSPPGEGSRLRNVPRSLIAIWRTLPRYWDAITATEPDVVIAQLEQLAVLTLLCPRLRWPVVVVEQNDPRMNPIGALWRIFRRVTYRRAALLVSVSEGVDSYFGWLPRRQRLVIHNPVELPLVDHAGSNGLSDIPSGSFIAAMGRLVPQKGFDLLLRAFQEAQASRREWQLVILGEGPERNALQDQARQLGIGDQVRFLGVRSNPRPYLLAARCFVLSSRWEGFPMALLEAMALGIPPVSFACPSGPSEIISDGEDGFLVAPNDVHGLAAAIARIMDDAALRAELGARARTSVARFGVEAVVERWEREVFPTVTASRQPPAG